METQMTQPKHEPEASSDAVSSPSAPAAADPKQQQQQRPDLLSDVAACQRRRSVVIATTEFLMSVNDPSVNKISLLARVDWKMVDVNLTLPNGLHLHSNLVTALPSAASQSQFFAMESKLQQTIIDKLLEYAPIASSLQPSQPRDADELLQWLAIEIAPSCCGWLVSFIQLLLATLHKRGFDLNRRDGAGRTLLTAYAAVIQESTAVEVARQLMQLGSDASVAGSDGRSAIYIWTEQSRADLLEQLIIGRQGPFGGLEQQIDLWQRDANGRTLLECMQSKGAGFCIAAAMLEMLQRHWAERERPLLQRMLTDPESLIPDLARLTLDFIDGGAAAALAK